VEIKLSHSPAFRSHSRSARFPISFRRLSVFQSIIRRDRHRSIAAFPIYSPCARRFAISSELVKANYYAIDETDTRLHGNSTNERHIRASLFVFQLARRDFLFYVDPDCHCSLQHLPSLCGDIKKPRKRAATQRAVCGYIVACTAR